jgi:hypothetical protein
MNLETVFIPLQYLYLPTLFYRVIQQYKKVLSQLMSENVSVWSYTTSTLSSPLDGSTSTQHSYFCMRNCTSSAGTVGVPQSLKLMDLTLNKLLPLRLYKCLKVVKIVQREPTVKYID